MKDPLLTTAGSINLNDREDKQPMGTMSSPINNSRNYPTSFREYIRSKVAVELACYVIFLGLPTILLKVIPHEPYDRSIPYQALDDEGGDYVKNLTYDLKEDKETIPSWALAVIILLTFLTQFILSWKVGNVGDVHSTVCCYVIVLSLTNSLTHILKNYCGYLRPIFYHVCQPDFSNGVGVCTQNSAEVRKSFPSGHSSMSFCAMVLFTYFLHQKFGVSSHHKKNTMEYYNNTGTLPSNDYGATTTFNNDINMNESIISYQISKSTILQRLYSFLSFLPIILALFIAGSRVHDNFHHPADVVGGAVLGTGIAVFFHKIWFPDASPIIYINHSQI